MPLQLQRAPELAQLAAEGAGMGIEQARHLHGQRAAAGDDSPGGEILPGGAKTANGLTPGCRQNQRSSYWISACR
jgi:hypothetical protein